jgi:hypothetical protein
MTKEHGEVESGVGEGSVLGLDRREELAHARVGALAKRLTDKVRGYVVQEGFLQSGAILATMMMNTSKENHTKYGVTTVNENHTGRRRTKN